MIFIYKNKQIKQHYFKNKAKATEAKATEAKTN
jgi:hypothetical protein